MNERSAFDEYLFGGGIEADAKKGVAHAIAELTAAGIEPAYSSTLNATGLFSGSDVVDGELLTLSTEQENLPPAKP